MKIKRRKIKGKGKGGAGERAVIRMLTAWITGRSKPEIFTRSSMSGGKATMEGVAGHTMAGDIVAIDKRALFFTDRIIIDVKNRKTGNVLDFVMVKGGGRCFRKSRGRKTKGKLLVKPSLRCWWIKLVKEAVKARKVPMLVFKRFGTRRWYAVFDTDDFNKLRICKKELYLFPVIVISGWERCTIVDFEQWLSFYEPEDIEGVFLVKVPKHKRVRK